MVEQFERPEHAPEDNPNTRPLVSLEDWTNFNRTAAERAPRQTFVFSELSPLERLEAGKTDCDEIAEKDKHLRQLIKRHNAEGSSAQDVEESCLLYLVLQEEGLTGDEIIENYFTN